MRQLDATRSRIRDICADEGPAAFHYGRQRGRRQVHTDRPAAVRFANVYEDQLASHSQSDARRTAGGLDLSLLTDGLRAEREQGITIDVAYRYFSTPRRKFIIADTPGHEQYTRNMATGASTADLAIVLMDARTGAAAVPPACVYRFPAGDSSRGGRGQQDGPGGLPTKTFSTICATISAFAEAIGAPHDLHSFRSVRWPATTWCAARDSMPWYTGRLCWSTWKACPSPCSASDGLRFPVQYVIRPESGFPRLCRADWHPVRSIQATL